jgi:ubiquinone/menaquinone biosynthesis C-methylase UbiE
VLDVGCGTGFLLTAAAQMAGQVVGVDLTAAMLAEARQRVEALGLHNVSLREAQAEALPFCDDRFDVVLCRLTLHHCEDPDRVLREIYRVCRPGGRVAVCDIFADDDPAKADLHNRIERLRDPSHVRYVSAAELVQMVERVGLTAANLHHWQTPRQFDEWAAIAAVREAEKGGLSALLHSAIPGDAAGLQVTEDAEGRIHFVHRWLVIGAQKPA